jgi:hypothetical protein
MYLLSNIRYYKPVNEYSLNLVPASSSQSHVYNLNFIRRITPIVDNMLQYRESRSNSSAVLLHIRDVPGLNLVPDTSYPDTSLWFVIDFIII